MTIEEIYYSEDISIRSFNVCNDNNLKDLTSILKHYNHYNTFQNLRNCGRKSNEELTALSLKYSNNNHWKQIITTSLARKKLNDILILNLSNLSHRSLNSLKRYLRGDLDIENFFAKIIFSSTFNLAHLKNIGSKSKSEISELLIRLNSLLESEIDDSHLKTFYFQKDVKNNNLLIQKINGLSRKQREIVNSFIEINALNLSNRGKNSINLFLNDNLRIRNISERILTNDRFNFQDIKNVGTKTITELRNFFDSIVSFIEKVSGVENENDLVALKNRFFIEKNFSMSLIPNEILESQSIFSLVDFLINKDALFDKNVKIIFQKAFKIYINQQEIILDDIARELEISKERVRQIRIKILENLFTSLQFVKNIEDDLYQKYDIDQNQYLIEIDNNLNELINSVNNIKFSSEFNTIIIYSYVSNKFDLVGLPEDVLQHKIRDSSGRHNWYNFYLVNKNISSLFNFNDFADDLERRITDRIEESYKFNFNSYLLNFSTSSNLNVLNNISKVAEKILNNEFGIYVDTDDNIRFARNSQKQIHEYAYEALKLLGKPSTVNEITAKVEELHPDYETNDAKVRASIQRDNGFVPIGRRSIFGLKEWENELENFKGGTIRQIVAEYLSNCSSPQNYSDITSYVLQFRPKTNEYNIIQNIKLDKSKTFIFFKNSFVGLLSKTYDKTFVSMTNSETNEKKSWEERYTELSGFLALNNRLPFSSGCPENEIKLYRWYKIQVGKTKNWGIEEEKSNLINEIIKNFKKGESTQRTSTNNIGKRKKVSSNSKYTYEDLTEFISINKRMPDSRDPNESSLYQFYYRNKKNLENIDVLTAQEAKLVELIEKFGSSKHPKFTIDELMEFIKINKRMPDSRETNERGLYQFLYKQRKLFEQGELEQSEENQFIEIAKIIQNYKYENKRN